MFWTGGFGVGVVFDKHPAVVLTWRGSRMSSDGFGERQALVRVVDSWNAARVHGLRGG